MKADNYSLGYAEFVVPLVKAVQELSEKVTNLESENLALNVQNEELKARLIKVEQLEQELDTIKAMIQLSNVSSEELRMSRQE